MVKGFLILLIFQWLGEQLVKITQAPIPGPVIGMLLLLVALLIRQQVSEGLQQSSHQLIQYLSLLFLPAGVGIFFLTDILKQHWLPISAAMFVGTLLSMVVCTLLAKRLMANHRD